MKNEKNILEIEVKCPECDGKGFNEVGPECGYPSSQCCGGCYHNVICTECDGGEILLQFEEEETAEIIKALIRGNMEEAQLVINDKHFAICQQ